MEKIEYHLDRIATALEIIAKTKSSHSDPTNTPDISPPAILDNFSTNTPLLLEEELFIETTMVYLEETKRKHKENLKRKSAIVVSQNLISMQMKFLARHLNGVTINEHSSAILTISKNEKPKALVRIYTDLGFHRADHWRKDIAEIGKVASQLNIPKENIFIIVISNLNGLDNQHVRNTLGYAISNKDILDESNIDKLKEYCMLYIDSLSGLVPYPKEQIHFLTGALHPNIAANNIFMGKELPIKLKEYPWISKPLENIISSINKL